MIKRIIALMLFASVASAQIPQHTMNWYRQYVSIPVAIQGGGGGLTFPMWESATMTASNSPLPVVVIGDSIYAGYETWNAFSHGSSAFWISLGLPAYNVYDMGVGNSNVVNCFKYCGQVGYNNHDSIIQVSMDSSSWTTVITNSFPNDNLGKVVYTNSTVYGRFVKFIYLSGYGDNYTRLYQMSYSSAVFGTPVMTAASTPSPCTVSASSTNGANYPYLAFDKTDGYNSAAWSSTLGTNAWILFDFGQSVTCNAFSVSFNPAYPTAMLSNYVHDASNNGIDFTVLSTGKLDLVSHSFVTNNNTTAYRYYRLRDISTETKYLQPTEIDFQQFK